MWQIMHSPNSVAVGGLCGFGLGRVGLSLKREKIVKKIKIKGE